MPSVLVDLRCAGVAALLRGRFRHAVVEEADVVAALQRRQAHFIDDPTVLVIGDSATSGANVETLLARVRSQSVCITVLVCGRTEVGSYEELPRLALAGADAYFALHSQQALYALVRRVAGSLEAPPPRDELRKFVAETRTDAAAIVAAYVIRRAYRKSTVLDAARWFGVDRKTLNGWLKAGGCRTAGRLARQARVWHVDLLLQERGLAVEEAARRAGFPDGMSVRRAQKRLRRG